VSQSQVAEQLIAAVSGRDAGPDLRRSDRAAELETALVEFMVEEVFPAEQEATTVEATIATIERLKEGARARGLWNLFLADLSQLDYAGLAEITGWSRELASEAVNSSAPDSGNMEILSKFGTAEQQERWLEPLRDGTIRSSFVMTEPGVASSDATNISTSIVRDGSEYVINGRKWWITGAADPRCKVLFVLGRTDPDADRHSQHSIVIVPRDTPGVDIVRSMPVFGRESHAGHCEIAFDDVRVPTSHLLSGPRWARRERRHAVGGNVTPSPGTSSHDGSAP
jgi:acyl-CoA dehydrogenase